MILEILIRNPVLNLKNLVCFLFINSFSHRIPFGFGSLLLKLSELSAIMDGHPQLPDEQANEAQQQNSSGHSQHNH